MLIDRLERCCRSLFVGANRNGLRRGGGSIVAVGAELDVQV
jgi:hypothetical protein